MRVPDRVRWGVDLLDVQPADRVLEVGCGPGLAAALVCARLSTGRLTALDRSATAVARTLSRNAEHVRAGRLEVVQGPLADGVTGTFDKALAINVNAFWTGPATREVAALHACLRPGGVVHVVYEGPGPTRQEVPEAVAGAMRAGGFAVTLTPGPGLCVTGVR